MQSASRIPRSRLWILAAFAIITALTLMAASCGGSDSATVDETALLNAVDELVAACNDRDHGRLQDLAGVGTQDRIRGQDNMFNDDVENVTVLDREVSIDGDSGVVKVMLEVTIDGETSEAERVWEYEKVDGVWVLSAVPDCTFS